MGVCIFFEGKLKSHRDLDEIIRITCRYARKNNLDYRIIEQSGNLTLEYDQDRNRDSQGIIIQPDAKSDPLCLKFDDDLYIREYCKTQFADISVHIKVIRLLRSLEPYFLELYVNDEGRYWETNDVKVLQEHFEFGFDAIENAKRKDPKLSGPYKEKGGRIVDLIAMV